jgi:hypothetical protein
LVTDEQSTPSAQVPHESHPENEEQDMGTSLASLQFIDIDNSNGQDNDGGEGGLTASNDTPSQEEETALPGLADLKTEFGGQTNAVALLPKLPGKAGPQR